MNIVSRIIGIVFPTVDSAIAGVSTAITNLERVEAKSRARIDSIDDKVTALKSKKSYHEVEVGRAVVIRKRLAALVS